MLLTDCKQYFNTNDLYEVLRVERTASAAQIKKGYYKQSMKWHPDKADDESEVQSATTKFQIITKAYQILADAEKRALYDETGVVDEENVLGDEETINVWRQVFKKVTIEDIKKFAEEYRGSEEEENDIVAAYNSWKGDVARIMDSVMCTTFDDEPRIKVSVNKRRRKAEKECAESEEALKEIKQKEGGGSLQELILRRQADRMQNSDSFLDSLAQKYGSKNKRAKK
ncbi:unnamed protein product [Nippostrongylus brasiliensis]|uniref:DnaJ homolog subfamily C member 9 (inferred by orthology to a human protein) n=1 Tax=Nippostrongylus brasiliensis TaxID=27835 RepID=A0A0N4Y698_NIPBR|nr:unnamed protein product [Nippostrongylus brasiliensis]